MRLPRALIVILLAFGCGHEKFDLLPPPDDAEAGNPAAGGSMTGGRASGGSGGINSTGGRSGRDAGPLPEPDCPAWQQNCTPCWSDFDCPVFGTLCDTFRHYCAPYCGLGFDGMQVRCLGTICDKDREICVECTSDTHCRNADCEFGKCVPKPPPECFNNDQCGDPTEPVCIYNVCQACTSNFQCGMDKLCEAGRCEPSGP